VDRSPRHPATVGAQALGIMLRRGALDPPSGSATSRAGAALIVRAAQEHMRNHLTRPMTTATLAAALEVPPRSLYRAFAAVLGDTPQAHVRRLRLHCVRRLLLTPDGPGCTVVAAARRLGLERDMGRLSGRYRDLFGEQPHETVASRNAQPAEAAPM
jgi:transcriptional regulator GlxA family with amidase domain